MCDSVSGAGLVTAVAPSFHGRVLADGAVRFAVELAAVPASVPAARNQARDCLSIWGQQGLIDDASQIVTELVTNAVQATAQLPRPRPVHLALSSGHCWLLISVADASPLAPLLRDPRPDAISGRGLAVVGALADRWGWQRVHYPGVKKAVWAEFHSPKTPNESLVNAASRKEGEPVPGT